MGLKEMWENMADKLSGRDDEYEDEYVDEYEDEDGQYQVQRPSAPALAQQSRAYRMVVVEPYVYDDSRKIADHLKSFHPVVINLEKTEEEVGRRLIDFVSGVTYAIEGRLEQVSQLIFLAVPKNMTVDTENYTYSETPTFSVDKQWGGR